MGNEELWVYGLCRTLQIQYPPFTSFGRDKERLNLG